jgi:hypothetical protein
VQQQQQAPKETHPLLWQAVLLLLLLLQWQHLSWLPLQQHWQQVGPG